MSRQGYLLLHDKRQTTAPKIAYFLLEDGVLRYYESSSCKRAIGEVVLSGCKLAVKAQRRLDGVPNSFFLETRKVLVKERTYTLGAPHRLELSAHSNADRQEWGRVLFSWQRYYWRDPVHDDSISDNEVRTKLEALVCCHYPKASATIRIAKADFQPHTPTSKLMQPLSFLRRNASTLRRSLSSYIPTSTSTSSLTPFTSCTSKTKFDISSGPESTDCARDKVALTSVACPVAMSMGMEV